MSDTKEKPIGVMLYNIVGDDGKTDKERNLELQHNIPIGSLVEVKYDEWYSDEAHDDMVSYFDSIIEFGCNVKEILLLRSFFCSKVGFL